MLCENNNSDKVENGKPDKGEGEFEIHGGIGAERDDGVIGKKEDSGEGAKEGEIDKAEGSRHQGRPQRRAQAQAGKGIAR